MITLTNQQIKKAFNRTLIPNISCLGVDTASRTGWANATTETDTVKIEYGFVDIDSKDKYYKYNKIIEFFANFPRTDKVIVEETFYGRNVKTFQMLSRLGGFIYAIAHLKKLPHKEFLLATTARKILGFCGNAKKEIIQDEFRKRLELTITDNDIIDAIILALIGVTE